MLFFYLIVLSRKAFQLTPSAQKLSWSLRLSGDAENINIAMWRVSLSFFKSLHIFLPSSSAKNISSIIRSGWNALISFFVLYAFFKDLTLYH